jgi:predicted ATPase
MKIQSALFEQFTVFQKVAFDFAPGINILVGANSTGKTHVLKAMYALQKAYDTTVRTDGTQAAHHQVAGLATMNKLQRVFRFSVPLMGHVHIVTDIGKMCAWSQPSDQTPRARTCAPAIRSPVPCLLLPTREFLAHFEGFIAAYSARELSFDETYFDLCVALSASPLKGERAKWAENVVARIRRELPGEVQLRDGRFYIGDLESNVAAEGHRKVAMLVQLLRNGGITENSTLYWDEPESSLNPRLIKVLADVLLVLASQGVQIFLATHDYLLSRELSLAAEYRTPESRVGIRFFCLSRESPTAPVTVHAGDTLADIPDEPILDEFAAHYDRQGALFNGQVTSSLSTLGAGHP